jgi:outer membrane lipoprotein-sorting protein
LRHRVRIAVVIFLALLGTLSGGAGLGASGAQEPPSSSDSPVAPTSLEELMGLLAASGGVRARFHETRHLSILAAPIETRGMLYFVPPNRLARHTTWPDRSTLVVRADEVLFRDAAGEQVMQLGSSKIAQGLVGNLAALLRGDLVLLRDRYSVEFRTDGPEWLLHLEPRSRPLRRVIERIRVKGRGASLAAMETRETGGDTTHLVFSEVRTGLDFEPADLERIFSLEGSAETP